MDKDYQVLRFENKIKPKDIGGLGVELDARKGSGNYDKERTQFNIEYVGLDGHTNLKSKVYDTIYTNKIHFNKGDNTNLLNGCIVTSGPDFFKKLGLPMKDTGRTYIEGKHIGEPIYCPDLKSKDDIPEQVYKYFNESFNFLSNFVGKENVVYAAIHLDEDTPHMHFYFLPVVNSVQRKVFETDETGKRWCNIGDILEELPSGEYKYVGRKKRNFVSEVDNVYPEELEDLLVTIPEIREAVVTPISDEMLQYVPRYHISLYTDQIDITALEKRITDLVMLKLGPSWLPGSFDYSVEPLKRMANSKVDITYYMEKDRQDMEEQRLTHEQAVGLRLRRK